MDKPKKKSKYKAKRIEVDGYVFDSEVEAKYYQEVVLDMHQKGLITEFKVHPEFMLQDKCERHGRKIGKVRYVADFMLIFPNHDDLVIDIKGMATETAKLKRNLFECKYPFLRLNWVCYSKKYGGWIGYDELQAKRREAKKLKKAQEGEAHDQR